jgi:hypothetical protein
MKATGGDSLFAQIQPINDVGNAIDNGPGIESIDISKNNDITDTNLMGKQNHLIDFLRENI